MNPINLEVCGKLINKEQGITPFDLLAECNIKDEEVLAAKWNDHCIDLYTPLMKSGKLDFIKVETPEGLEIMRHSMAHLMAHAVLRIYKDVEFAIGPVIEDGFYYDFDLEHKFSPEDFEKIEAEMKKIIEENLPIRRIEFQTKEEALKALKNQRAKFKKELIQDLPDNETFSFYTQGDFMDLCRGPHVDRTGKLKYFKIMSVAGAYWRGDERREMLQRLYATAFFHQNEVDEFVQAREEAKKRDHRKLGRELDLFSFQEEGPGFPFWHPRGTILIKEVIRYVEKILIRYKYSEIMTPMILNEELWHKSGHWDHYQSNMYFVQIDEQNYAIKPMNCPGCCLVFKNDLHSFRDLPVRLAEWGKVHRHEKRGVLSGLQRVRAFTQDDAHVFCLPEQLEDEIKAIMDMIHEIYTKFGFTYRMELSTRPADSIGTDEMWEIAEKALKNALDSRNMKYQLNPGDGAFYGPKIDYHIKDCIGRDWQCGTIQVDMAMPERFDLSYIGQDGQPHRPVMVHRALLGSVERFVSILIEQYAGAFPTWMAPEQVRIIPISAKKHLQYAQEVCKKLQELDIRAVVQDRGQRLNYEIREAETSKIPYMLVIGNREQENNEVSVRSYRLGDLQSMPFDKFVDTILKEIATKSADSCFKTV
ncbi:MAG: threonine--tRNA ligase [Planctomycetes bacterium]|jgi:threonyl-tRNA synthetase|nr:threonine--tRNA ligase [Planctomycetota bacterium]HON43742.1 threonine--tRNA ligase [Planctomycetota bacterium]HPY74510.1 threonine--tRNA ligase [Planctomycetota bacterium]HQB00113.1 threonine--tRNA ligase [Planctomycetota bacterium]HRU50975.1 threonine--tRNA ligase [Planctomycetota bacterium]